VTDEENVTVKVKLSLFRPWGPLGLREVDAPTFLDIPFTDGGKVVSPTRLPLFYFQEDSWYSFFVRGWVDPRAIVRLEELGKLKKSTLFGIRTGDLPACSIVTQPTALPRAPKFYSMLNILLKIMNWNRFESTKWPTRIPWACAVVVETR
jgi:hypothetical protein